VTPCFRFGGFEFDATTGDLRRLDGAPATRLAPQPARLLALLLERSGTLVSREDIRAAVWSDAHVDFDASLHFCVRQVREALGDSASDPRYVQTVPRRGYRLMIAAARTPPKSAAATGRVGRPRRRTAALAALAAAAALALTWAAWRPAEAMPLRVAVMPFEPPAIEAWTSWPPIAEWILEGLDLAAGEAVAIIGPTSTSAYAGTAEDIARLVSEHDVQYVLNGRFLDPDGEPRMLAELIRVSDGVHVWVRSFDRPQNGRGLGLRIGRETAAALGVGGPPGVP
jgi:DNA-binding winged helix-turn-helix (wHTH) protein/TolB-like protein